MTRRFSELLAALGSEHLVAASGDCAIDAPVVEAADAVLPGGVFVARRGRSVDGHTFIALAVERGAAAVVGELSLGDLGGLSVPYAQVRDAQQALGGLAAAYYGYPSRRLIVVGVTGTDGKTTTSTLIHRILQAATGGKAGLISTIQAELGGASADTGLHVTTPGAPQVQAFLAQMAANGLTHAVVEMTSHGLHQGRLNGVDIDVAVLTNLTHEHLDYHGTFEQYRAAKAILFDMLDRSDRKPNQPKISVINGDDPNAAFFAQFAADIRQEYRLDQLDPQDGIAYLPDQTRFRLRQDGQTYATRLLGEFNVRNALAAIVATRLLGVLPEVIQRGLWAVEAISGRMERIDEGQAFTAIVDFAHTPNALQNALETCRRMLAPGGRLIAVFGSAGLRDVDKRRLMAEVGARLADYVVLTAEDPRTESLEAILQMMADGCVSQGGIEGRTFVRVPDRGEALYHACQSAAPGDIVVACGKGHEQSMCFGAVEHPWDDRHALRTALRGAPLATLPTAAQRRF